MKARKNPFYQPARQWQIRIIVDRSMAPAIEDAFGDMALAISSFEVIEDHPEWCIDIVVDSAPDHANIESKLALVSGMAGVKTPAYKVRELESKDWVSEVERSFPPLTIGRFYVHGTHIKEEPPHAKIELKVNAGAAFGSGEHATTSGCLLALEHIARKRRFRNPLDMGCGSGILAMAMAKLWHTPVTAIDIDPVSIAVTKDNARLNQLHSLIKAEAGDGYHTTLARKQAPYDLIVANILARPLMKMAPALAHNLTSDGIAVLSGLLTSQEQMVLSAQRMQGLKLSARIVRNGWSTLLLRF